MTLRLDFIKGVVSCGERKFLLQWVVGVCAFPRPITDSREFKKLRRRRRSERRFKNESLYFTYESRGTLKLFTLFITVKTTTKLNLAHSDKFEVQISKLAVVVHVLQTTQNLVISRCCFAEDGTEIVPRTITHVHSHYSAH